MVATKAHLFTDIRGFGRMTEEKGEVGAAKLLRTYSRMHFRQKEPLPTLIGGDLALAATPAADEAGARAQVARRQCDGSWLRILDRPDLRRELPSGGITGSLS